MRVLTPPTTLTCASSTPTRTPRHPRVQHPRVRLDTHAYNTRTCTPAASHTYFLTILHYLAAVAFGAKSFGVRSPYTAHALSVCSSYVSVALGIYRSPCFPIFLPSRSCRCASLLAMPAFYMCVHLGHFNARHFFSQGRHMRVWGYSHARRLVLTRTFVLVNR